MVVKTFEIEEGFDGDPRMARVTLKASRHRTAQFQSELISLPGPDGSAEALINSAT